MTTDGPTLTRRGLLAGLASSAALGAVPAAAAQESGVFTEAAIPDSAPTFDGDDYVGLFVHISGPGEDQSSEPVRNCAFAGDGTLVTWDAMLVDKSGTNAQETTTVHAKQGADGMQGGHLFIVNDQQNCGDGYVQLTLEQVGASGIDVQTDTEGGAGDGSTETDSPGFGPVAGVAGLLGAGWLAKRRED